MPRNMSFTLTTNQILNRSKTVTRRFGWWFLKSGDRLWAVEKAQGLKTGERIKRLALIEVISTSKIPLSQINQADCCKEGFPHLSPDEFISMLCQHYQLKDTDKPCNRIEFKYLNHDLRHH